MTYLSTIRKMAIDIGGMRVKYNGVSNLFQETDLVSKEPFGQFKLWFDEACAEPSILEANAMCLSTANKAGIPSARYVLCKGFGKDGFTFFTNYTSRKAKDLDENPNAALTFYWETLKRSVRIEGVVQKISASESDEYFHSRPRDSQFGACVSNQSTIIKCRDTLVKTGESLREKYKDPESEIPRPNWGGYLVIPKSIEFWQGQSDRLHDRIRFRKPEKDENINFELAHKGDEGWIYERLSP